MTNDSPYSIGAAESGDDEAFKLYDELIAVCDAWVDAMPPTRATNQDKADAFVAVSKLVAGEVFAE